MVRDRRETTAELSTILYIAWNAPCHPSSTETRCVSRTSKRVLISKDDLIESQRCERVHEIDPAWFVSDHSPSELLASQCSNPQCGANLFHACPSRSFVEGEAKYWYTEVK